MLKGDGEVVAMIVLFFAGGALGIAVGSAAVDNPMQNLGQLGDYVGGVWGTAFGALTVLAIWLTWRSANRSEGRNRTHQVFSEMLRSHEEILGSISLNGAIGREALATILSEYYFIYNVVSEENEKKARKWSLNARLDIAYTFLFFGPQLQTQKILERYGGAGLKGIGDRITQERQRNELLPKPRGDRTFKGHQNRLSQYFRNLYIAYKFIDESPLLEPEKRDFGKVLRAKLSNYEQALLCLNCTSHLGGNWISTGLIRRYMPMKNVPQNFFSFDEAFALKDYFPDVVFEWEDR